jgi:hypothetical protein
LHSLSLFLVFTVCGTLAIEYRWPANNPLPKSSLNDLNQQELYEREKRTESVDIDANTCDECETLTACSRGTAISGSRWQNPSRVERMVAGTCEAACRRPKRSLDSDRRCRLRRCRYIRRADPDSHLRQPGQQWFALYQLPYLRHLRSDPFSAADRPQQRIGA